MNDYIDMNKITLKKLFKERLDEEQKQSTLNKTLFDYRCAKLDFEDMIAQKNIENERNEEKQELINRDLVNNFDLKPYKEASRFKEISVTDNFETLIIGDQKKQIKNGEWHKYVCVKRGCGFSILKTEDKKK